MSHHIEGFIGKREELSFAFSEVSLGRHAKVYPLPQGFGFMPLTDELYDDFKGDFTEIISKIRTIALIRTDFFGGFGTQDATWWYEGQNLWERIDNHGEPINEVLQMMGVQKGDSDEFDALHLGKMRSNEDFK